MLYNVDCILFCCFIILFNNWVEMTLRFDGWENGDVEEHSQDLEAGKWLSWEPYQGPLLASAGISALFQAPLWFKQGWVMMEWRGSFLSHFQGVNMGKPRHFLADRVEQSNWRWCLLLWLWWAGLGNLGLESFSELPSEPWSVPGVSLFLASSIYILLYLLNNHFI